MKIRKIYNEIQLIWNEKTNSYDTIYEDSYSHDGDIYEMAKGEVDLSGADTAAALLKKISKAARRVTKDFDGWSKATKENADVLKILAKNSKGAEGSIEDLVKVYRGQIEAMLKLKAITDAQKKSKKELADLNKKDQQSIKASNKLIEQQIVAEQKLKAINIKRHIIDEAVERKKHLAIIKKHVNAHKKEQKTKARVRAELLALNLKLKEYSVNLKSLNISHKTYKKALEGNNVALAKIKRTTQEVIRTGKLRGKQLDLFQVKTHRNAMTLSALRSKLLMVAFAYGLMQRAITFLTDAYMKQEKVEAMVSSAIASTGGAARLSSQEIYDYASSIQEATGVGDEMVLSSSALLLTFKKVGGEEFKRAQSSIVDLTLALNQGTISEEKMKSSTIMLGKALNDPIKGMDALGRAGVTFDAQQKQQIRTYMELGDIQAAQGVILEELESQVGGLGEAFRKTTEGRMMAMAGAFSDMKEAMATVFIPAITALLEVLTILFKLFGNKHIWLFIAALTAASARTYMLTNRLTMATAATAMFAKVTGKATWATKGFSLAAKSLGRALGYLIVLEVSMAFLGKIFGKGKDDAEDFEAQLAALEAQAEATSDAAYDRIEAQKEGMYELRKEMALLYEKGELARWIIQQEKRVEGVIRSVSDEEIAYKKRILAVIAAQKKRLKTSQLIEKSNKDLYKSQQSLLTVQLKHSKVMKESFSFADEDLHFSKELVDSHFRRKMSMEDMLEVEKLYQEYQLSAIDHGGELIEVEGRIQLSLDNAISGRLGVAMANYEIFKNGMRVIKMNREMSDELAKEESVKIAEKYLKALKDANRELDLQLELLLIGEGLSFGEDMQYTGFAYDASKDVENLISQLEELVGIETPELMEALAKFPDADLDFLGDPAEKLKTFSFHGLKAIEMNRDALAIKKLEVKFNEENTRIMEELRVKSAAYQETLDDTEPGYKKRREDALKEVELLDKQLLQNAALFILGKKAIQDSGTRLDNEKEAAKVAEKRAAFMGQLVTLGQEALSAEMEIIQERAARLDEEAAADVERIKDTYAYKYAAARNDKKAMEDLENQARSSTLPARKKAFEDGQNVKKGELAMNLAVAIYKAYADYGFLTGSGIAALLTLGAALQLNAINRAEGPKFARGGDFVTSGPQSIMVGDNPGGRERVQVTPLSSPNFDGPKSTENINITFSGNVMSRDFIEREAIPKIKDAIRRGADIGIG